MKHLFKLILLILLLGFVVGFASNINAFSFSELINNNESSYVEDYKKDLVVNDYDDYSDSGDYIHTLHLLCGYQKSNHTWGSAEENFVNLNLTISNSSSVLLDSYDKFILYSDSVIGDNDFIIYECSGYGYINNDYVYPTMLAYYDSKLYVLDENYNSIFVINSYNFTKGSYYYYFNVSDSVEYNSSNNNENNENNGNNETTHTYLHSITITNTDHSYLSNNSVDKQCNNMLIEYSFTFSITTTSDSQINTYNALYNYFNSINGGSDYTINGSGVKSTTTYYIGDSNGEWYDGSDNLNKIKFSNGNFCYGFASGGWTTNMKFLNTTQVNTYYGIEYDFIITDYTFNISDSVSMIS